MRILFYPSLLFKNLVSDFLLELKISDLEGGGKLRILAVPVHREGQHHGGQSEGGLQLNVDQDQNHHVLETAANLYCHVYEAATQAQDGREVGQVEGRFLFSSTGVPTILVCF